ncbi:MAG: polysaccharide deacetylase family protein [Bacteroidetes bacterium]|nr:polysaccharide deacetylase family protein [Bacteroidota bacterium]
MILIYSNVISSRLKYVLKLLFNDILKTEYQISSNLNGFNESKDAKINYSDLPIQSAISMRPSDLLFETHIAEKEIIVEEWEGLPVFFKTDKNADVPYDIFSVLFYLVSRYEEYLEPKSLDQHGRFKAESSIAFKHHFLEQPLVNQIALKLKEIIVLKYSEITFLQSEYQYIPTIDVDIAFSYIGKGFWRNSGGIIRSILQLKFKHLTERVNVLMNLIPDPYNNFDFILSKLDQEKYNAIIFMNLGKYGRYDKNISFQNLKFFRLLKDLHEKAQVNIHPSYASNSDLSLLKDEIAKLEHILGGDVIRSRQHFLILNFPETYRNLISLGIIEDYSLGYPSQLGFRASICTPFRFYDLLNEEETQLVIRPFAFMDGTMTDYLKLNSADMIKQLKLISDSVRRVKGDLIGIWHNSSLAEDEELKKLFVETLSILK